VPAYLTERSNAPARNYALAAASDKQITYSVSSNTDAVLANWVDRIYDYLGKLINMAFMKVASGGEFAISLETPNYTDLYESDYFVNNEGLIRWSSVHNTKQYGGVDDQRTLVRAIGNSLGLSRLNWAWKEAGNTGVYTTSNTIMSETPWIQAWFGASDFGRTVFFTQDDKSSLKEIYSSSSIDGITGIANNSVVHEQRIKEDLLIGANGQIDIFKLHSKGMNAENKEAFSFDPGTGLYWVNDYNIPTIVNFNPYEGDKILISRRLYAPLNPIGANTRLPKTIKSGKKNIPTSKFLKSIKIDLITTNGREEFDAATKSVHNTIYNEAGKLMLNVNGVEPFNGPDPVTGNGQLLAFIDTVGGATVQFQTSWLGLF
jgi:hypothetical protein